MHSLRKTQVGMENQVSDRKSSFSRMKEAAAALALIVAVGCLPGKSTETKIPEIRQGQTTVERIDGTNDATPPFAFGQRYWPNQKQCESFPEIEQWSQKRNLDPKLVRALILTESGLDPCAAAKVCSKDAIQSKSGGGCFPADFSGNSEGYSIGYDEMHDPRASKDPAQACRGLPTAPPVFEKSPEWRWFTTGLMQTIEPPYTFWPASHSPDGKDGIYTDVFKRSGLSAISLDVAKACNPHFNPFDSSDSICLGTAKLEKFIRYGHAIINIAGGKLGFGDEGRKADVFAAYVAVNMYTGYWLAKTRDPKAEKDAHPACASSMPNGECYVASFAESKAVTNEYCQDKADGAECKGKMPRYEPPYSCYGASDFVKFVRECWSPHSHHPDVGANVMSMYYSLKIGCK